MIHHLPQACKSAQKSAPRFSTLDLLVDNPPSVPHHGHGGPAASGTTKLSSPSIQQPCPRLRSASDGKRWARTAGNPATINFTTRQQRPTPVKDLPLEASIASSEMHATKVSNLLLPPGQTSCVLSAHSVPKGNVKVEILSNTKSCEVQRGGMLRDTAGICSSCISAAVSMSSSFGGAGQKSSGDLA